MKPVVLLTLLFVALGPASMNALAEEGGPVLPPTAQRPLERALGQKLGPGLTLQSAAISKDHVLLSYGRQEEGESTLSLTLRHPSEREGALHVGPAFSIHGSKGSDQVALTLGKRLLSLKVEEVWTAPSPVQRAKEKTPELEVTDHSQEAEDALRLALHAARIDNLALATERLVALEEDERLGVAAGLDLAEAWYRVGDKSRGAEVARRYVTRAGPSTPMEAIRASVLGGHPLTLVDLQASLAKAHHECKLGALGRSLEAVGRLADAHALLGGLFESQGCMEAALEIIAWHVAAHDFHKADALSIQLLKKYPESEEAVGRRAQVLLALKRPLEAVQLLEPVVWKNPHSGLLSALLGVYNRVSDHAWQDAKRVEIIAKADAEKGDKVAAFYAGVLLHYDGQFSASTARLEPLLDFFGEQPRLFIYLGMNTFNLGDAPGALKLLKQGQDLRAPDPDIYYCLAEVHRFSDPPEAASNLRHYLAQTRGSPTANPKKRHRVETMATSLDACIAAGGPVPCPGPWEHPYGHAANEPPPDPQSGPTFPSWAPIALALVAGGALLAWRRARASSPS